MASPLVRARIAQNQWKRKQDLLEAARGGYLTGVKAAVKAAAMILDEKGQDTKDFESEILRRLKLKR